MSRIDKYRATGLIIAALLIHICLSFTTRAQVYTNADSAFIQAKSEGKVVFLYFTGSDWCTNCIRFEKNILGQPEFMDYAQKNLILLQADFPQRKKLSQEQLVRNEMLAEKYNPQGSFPTLLIISSDQTKFNYIHYSNQDKQEFIKMLDKSLQSIKKSE